MKLCLILLPLLAGLLIAGEKTETIEGKLIVRAGQAATLETAGHRQIQLDGDQPTRKVLQDERLNGRDIHATGHFTEAGVFMVDPQQKHGLLVHDHDRLKTITYWCAVCSLRSYTPGPCACCDGETALDL